jgi:eukaryotic-like serine/threonine-protein kinase
VNGAPQGAHELRALPPEVQEGALLAERYRIGRVLGSGAMGVVVAAEHVELNDAVAIKVLLHDSAQASPEALSRFTREAWAASKIKSEYVARVSDSGRLSDGTPYIVMEYLDGSDLEQVLRTEGPLDMPQTVELMLQACEALAEAHALGIYHRDLKPSNLFCVQRSDGLRAIKLLDFGISKVVQAPASASDPRLTATSSTLGTPLYMSPEQMRSGRTVDERSDIWALGVILYECLMGRAPFAAENLADLAVRIATETPDSISQHRKDVPAGLERVVLRCLAKDRTQRYPDVADLARALVPFGPPRTAAHAERARRILHASISARSMPTVRVTAVTASGSHSRLRSAGPEPRAGNKRTMWSIAAALLVAAIVAVGVRWWRQPQQPTAAQVPHETGTNAAQAPSAPARLEANVLQAPTVADPTPAPAPAAPSAAAGTAAAPTPPAATAKPVADFSEPSATPARTSSLQATPTQPTAASVTPSKPRPANKPRPAAAAAATTNPAKQTVTPPAASKPIKDTQLEALGGRE